MPIPVVYILFTVLLLAIGAFGVALGRALAAWNYQDDLRREYLRGRKVGYEEGRKVLDLGRRTPPIMGQGYTSNRAKKAGH